jgi:hypothetical protein
MACTGSWHRAWGLDGASRQQAAGDASGRDAQVSTSTGSAPRVARGEARAPGTTRPRAPDVSAPSGRGPPIRGRKLHWPRSAISAFRVLRDSKRASATVHTPQAD